MLEPTNLTTGAQLLAETLESHYGVDTRALFQRVGLDIERLQVPGARYPWRNLRQLWEAAVEVTGDPCLGLAVGARMRVTSFHAIGLAWLASRTLHEALDRLVRYYRLLSTAPITLRLEDTDNDTRSLTAEISDPALRAPDAAGDAFTLGVLRMARLSAQRDIGPVSISLPHEDHGRAGDYVLAFGAPVFFDAQRHAVCFERSVLEAPLPGHNPDLAGANEEVAERYLASLDPERVATEVRRLLVDMLPSGEVSQVRIARRLNRSLSTLQRQLQTEGITYQQLRDETRQRLAEAYVRDRALSLSEIAYLLGFSDQSNFSRAFRRWTGMSPREYRG